MKLVLVNYEYPPVGGGAGNATENLATSLAADGHDVVVVTSQFEGHKGWTNAGGHRILRLSCLRRRRDRSNLVEMLSFVVAALFRMPPWMRKERPDGLIVFFSLPCGPIGLVLGSLFSVPYLISLRGGDVPGTEPGLQHLQTALAPLRRSVLRRARAVIANSIGLAERSMRIDPIPVEVIANGVDTTFFTPKPPPHESGNRRNFLFVGRFQPQKNLEVLLTQFQRAMAVFNADIHLTLVGDGPDRPLLENLATELGIADKLTWHGWLGKDALRLTYREADVFLNPSLYEGLPNTVLEAMASGLPVVASRVTGNDELVIEGLTGWLFDLSNPDQLGDLIAQTARDPARLRACGGNARALVVDNYSWRTSAKKYGQYFEAA